MNLTPYTESSKTMHQPQDERHATPPPSYTSTPRSRRPKTKHENHQYDTKRLVIRGVQLLGVLLCVYRMWEKNHLKEKHEKLDRRHARRERDAGIGRRRPDEWDGESMHDEGAYRAERAYGNASHGSETMYGFASEGSESTYLDGGSGERRRRRREREGGGGRIEYGEYRD